ncbi:muts domain V-domain-containing protein [Phycomyces blakesleeanus]|uniref:Muts domain V-domain-containing protein n=1 Tax=Phycomyces blakesleeanus TaxID=4837 RepID=A0ABR3AYQ5_PHYBL
MSLSDSTLKQTYSTPDTTQTYLSSEDKIELPLVLVNTQKPLGHSVTNASIADTAVRANRKHIMALAEGRGKATEIGMCTIYLDTNECILSQFADSQTYIKTLHQIHLNNPQKILVASMPLEHGINKLCQLIEQKFPNISIESLSRNYFSDDVGMTFLRDLGIHDNASTLLLGISKKYYCLAAAAAIFRYVLERNDTTYALHTILFKYQVAQGTMLIDIITARNLELVTNSDKSHSKETLYGILNHTCTPMGARLLRMAILQPLTEKQIIQDRLDAVEELVDNEEMLFGIQSSLKYLSDMDHIISDIIKIPKKQTTRYSEAKINNVITLRNALKTIKNISEIIKCSNSTVISLALNANILLEQIKETLNDEVGYEKSNLGLRNQKCYAVKETRQAYKETIQDIYEMSSQYIESTGLPIKLQFANAKGFHLSIASFDKIKGPSFPPVFINVVKKKKSITFTTMELLKRNCRLEESLTEIYLMSDSIVTNLLEKIRSNISIMYKLSESIASIDLLASFAKNHMLLRPEFTNTFAIKSGRHPILDIIRKGQIVPNDTYISLSSSFQFITGPNMSGKSTYIKQIALLTIMAQIGSFVPAEYASFRISNQLLSRLANDSFLDMNTSSFMSEMREAAYVLHNINDTSLILIDELGRGTSFNDALGISGAICEEIIRSKAYCLFSTHLHQLTTSLSIYPNVVNLQLKVDITDEMDKCAIHFLYTVEDGNTTKLHYGLKAAQLVGFPNNILARAHEISTKLEDAKIEVADVNSSIYLNKSRQKVMLWFADKVTQLNQTELCDEMLYERLLLLQDEYNNHLRALQWDGNNATSAPSEISDYYTI